MNPPSPIDVVPNSGVSFAASTAVVRVKSPALGASLLEGIAFGLVLITASTLLAGRDGLIGAFIGYAFTCVWSA